MPTVFISYSHLDEPEKPANDDVKWLTYVQSFLFPAVKGGKFELWDDRQLKGGADWDPEIEDKLRVCDVFVLLVSRHSTASHYIITKEIEITRERKARGDKVLFYPIVLTETPKAGLELVQDINLRPRDGKPLFSYPKPDRDRHMSVIADEIADHIERMGLPADTRPKPNDRASSAILIDVGRLPETPYIHLVGRDDELKRLDDAWENPQINIISAVAEGGAGKSALINEWLKRLQQRNYGGAEAVLGWSFYSQGSKERATSGDSFLDWTLSKLGITLRTNSSSAKGEAIAEALANCRILLVLDGVEPLQHGPGSEFGKLKDQGLRALLRRFAAAPSGASHGLIVITTRAEIADLRKWQDASSQIVDVEKLSDEAGAALLKDNSIWGTDTNLKAASAAFGGHALAISLLAGYLKETWNGDIRQRDHIRALIVDPENPRHDHARRVMESYAKEWLSPNAVFNAIMSLIGLFDRPADAGCLAALRRKPAAKGLTESLIKLSDEDWNKAINRLREARLLLPIDKHSPNSLDAHPLVREWFGERLKLANEKAWRSAHNRLYEHLRDTTEEGVAPTLDDLAPLYQAITHGCCAGHYQVTLEGIYESRICRRNPYAGLEFYSFRNLGAFGTDLAAISWFFQIPYELPHASLTPSAQSWLLGMASTILASQGRFLEALPAGNATLKLIVRAGDWKNAAIQAGNLGEFELISGHVDAAVALVKKSIEYADRSKDRFSMLAGRARLACALDMRGDRNGAQGQFSDAEKRQQAEQPYYPLLYSLQGYFYCDFLLAAGQWQVVHDRATTVLEWDLINGSLLSRALSSVAVARSHLGLALEVSHSASSNRRVNACATRDRADEAVDRLRASGDSGYAPLGLASRASFRRSIGDWHGAEHDLSEIEEIAEPGSMRLHLCDLALGRARLAFARVEAFAPLNGLLEAGNPPKPTVPSADEIEEWKRRAKEQIVISKKLIAECGYHRRDAELAELEDVLSGKRRFADLPPHV